MTLLSTVSKEEATGKVKEVYEDIMATKGIDFDAVDKKPTNLFFLIIAPPQDKDNLYLQVLGQIVDIIKDKTSRNKFLEAATFEQLQAILGKEDS